MPRAKSSGYKTSAATIRVAQKQARALELRLAGKSLAEIAVDLDYAGQTGASKAILSGIRKIIQEPAAAVRDLELMRLDAMLAGLWPKARVGEPWAVDRVLKIMERRAKLLGLDEPAKINVALLVASAATELGLTETERLALLADVEAFIAAPKALTS